MPAQTIIKLKIRRGTDSQRKVVILEQGELGYTTDTARVFVGDGTTYGGRPVGSVIHNPVSNSLSRNTVSRAVQNDVVFTGSLMYQLTGTDYSNLTHWLNISPKVDGLILKYISGSNILGIQDFSLGYTKLNPNVVTANGGLSFGIGISANVDNVTMNIVNNKLAVKGITKDSISSTSFGNSIIGGSGSLINVNFDPLYFNYNTNLQLSLSAIPAGSVKLNSIDNSFIGNGLVISGGFLKTQLQNVDNVSIESTNGVISLKAKHDGNSSAKFENINYNEDGIITGRSSMFGNLLSVSTSISGVNSLYNGSLNQSIFTNQQTFTALCTDITLATSYVSRVSSAGFIVINTAAGGDIAIPIFKFGPIPPIS